MFAVAAVFAARRSSGPIGSVRSAFAAANSVGTAGGSVAAAFADYLISAAAIDSAGSGFAGTGCFAIVAGSVV